MPEYVYKHPKKNKYVQVIQTMNEDHIYIDKDGLQWIREYTVPQGLVKDNYDITNSKDFAHRTKHSRGSIGDLLDRSQELSDKRVRHNDKGEDTVKKDFLTDWSIKRKNKPHPDETRSGQELAKDIKVRKQSNKK